MQRGLRWLAHGDDDPDTLSDVQQATEVAVTGHCHDLRTGYVAFTAASPDVPGHRVPVHCRLTREAAIW